MTSSAEQFLQLRSEVAGLRSRVTGLSASGQIYASSGQRIMYGCKVTQGSSATDMIVALESAASGDSAHLNPDLSVTPTYQFEYPNIAALKSGGFYSADLEATVDAVPATGLGRYDIAYIYVGPTGPGFAIATGTPGAGVKTAFDADGLETGAYDPDTEAAIPVGAFAVARIYVEDDASGIANARIADLRIFGLTAEDLVDVENAVASTAADALATAADRVQTGLDAVATAADAVSTAADAVATAADRVQTGLDASSADADRIAAAGSATDSLNSANASAASAALAAEIVNISEVQFFTNPLTKAIRVALSGSASVAGPRVLDNANLDMGTNDFTVFVQKRISTTRPAATEVLYTKYDSATGTGIALELMTTGHLRLYINRFPYKSTATLPSATNVEPVIMTPVVRETATTAGSIKFVVDGVQLGDALEIAVPTEKVTNGTFDSDITGWTISPDHGGAISWASGKLRAERISATTSATQAIAMAAGETRVFSAAATHITGPSVIAKISLRTTSSIGSGSLLADSNIVLATSGNLYVTYTSPTAQTVYLHATVYNAAGQYDFDNITSVPSTYSVDNAANLHVLGTSTTTTEGDYLDGGLYNRALAVAECLAHCVRGPALAAVGASQTPVWSSDFSGGSDGFNATSNITVAGTQLGPDGQSDWLKLTAIVNGAANSIRAGTSFPETLGGQRCRFIGQIYHTGNATVAGIQIADGNSGGGRTATILSGGGTLISPSGTQQAINCEFTGLGVSLRVRLVNASNSTSGVTAGDSVLLKGLISYKTGLVAHWPAFNAQSNTGQVFDRSGNKSHMLLPASGATVIPSRLQGQVRGTNEWTASTSTQYVVGPNQSHLNAATAFTTLDIIASASGTFHIGDSVDVDRFGASIALSVGRNRVTLITPFVDGTNLKLTLTPTSSYTGILETTASFVVLED